MTLQVVVKPFLSEKKLVSELFQSTTKETLVDNSWQHCRPTTSNIVGYYMLNPFAHPVACCCKWDLWRNNSQHCWAKLHTIIINPMFKNRLKDAFQS